MRSVDPTFAMRCLTQLAVNEMGVSALDIARFEGLAPDQVQEILDKLVAAGLVTSQKGGYRLAREESRIRVGDVRGALADPSERSATGPGNAITLLELLDMEERAFESAPVAELR